MSKPARFQSAVLIARPAGVRVIEVFSRKLNRRLQCFGESAFEQWMRLEVDPSVESYCERPICLKVTDGELPVDFWVRQNGREVFLVIEGGDQTSASQVGDVGLEVRSITPAELAAARMWVSNWQRMLPVLTSCRGEISLSMQRSIMRLVTGPTQISRIEQEFVTDDPTPARAALFDLIYAGKLQAPQLHVEELSFLTTVLPAEDSR